MEEPSDGEMGYSYEDYEDYDSPSSPEDEFSDPEMESTDYASRSAAQLEQELRDILTIPSPADLSGRVELHQLCERCRRLCSGLKSYSSDANEDPADFESIPVEVPFSALAAAAKQRCHLCTLLCQFLTHCVERSRLRSLEETDSRRYAARRRVSVFTKLLSEPAKLYLDSDRFRPLKIQIDCGDALLKLQQENGIYGYYLETRIVDENAELVNTFRAREYSSTSSLEHTKLAKYWIERCCATHQLCSARVQPGFIPSRVICVEQGKSGPVLRVVHTGAQERGSAYLTLSHCWGGAQGITQLKTGNVAAYQADLPFRGLPRTFQDAVQITQRVGVRYLWIDSLCIIQDSKDDWTREAASMSLIYENALCTIAAAGAPDAHAGCFAQRDPLPMTECRIARNGTAAVYVQPEEYFLRTGSAVNHTPLVRRAWVLQERVLSPRILHFGDQELSWTCQRGYARDDMVLGNDLVRQSLSHLFDGMTQSAGDDDLAGRAHSIESVVFFQRLLSRAFDPADIHAVDSFNETWYRLVSEYTECALTQGGDKLIALSALVQRIQKSTGLTYVAGLWWEMLPYSICWRVVSNAQPPPDQYRAPSWSWASRDGQIGAPAKPIRSHFVDVLADFIAWDTVTDPSDVRKTGAVTAARLEVEAPIKRVSAPRSVGTPGPESILEHYKLYDGDTKLGSCWPDSPSLAEDTPGLHLMSLIYSCEASRNDTSKPIAFPTFAHVEGLMLVLDSSGTRTHPVFRRVGYFSAWDLSHDPGANRWFWNQPKWAVTLL